MILKGSILITRSPGELWLYIQDPRLRMKWDPRILAVVSVSGGEPSAGSRFRIRFKFTGFESNFQAEIMERDEPERLVFHLSGGSLPFRGYIQEIFELREHNKGTLVKYSIEIQNPGINIFLKSRILTNRLFHSFSRRELRQLKDFAETNGNLKL
jgi:uncharacterized protein YndB with AHSA1/START domain